MYGQRGAVEDWSRFDKEFNVKSWIFQTPVEFIYLITMLRFFRIWRLKIRFRMSECFTNDYSRKKLFYVTIRNQKVVFNGMMFAGSYA